MTLEKLRKDIKTTDSQILRLIAKRNNISKKIGQYKKKKKIKITDRKQEKEIFLRVKEESRKLKLNKKFVEDIFKTIIKESKRLQK